MYTIVPWQEVKEAYKLVPHSFTKEFGGKAYCPKCGLVHLNNDYTRWAVRMGCMNYLHPDAEAARKRYAKP